MAKNLSKPQNAPKNIPKQETPEEKSLKIPFRLQFFSFSDRRLHLAGGFLLLFFSLFLTFAFISYLFTGRADHSVVTSLFEGSLRESGRESENWLGLSGALISDLFIFRLFGISSFLVIPVLFLTGYKIVFKKELFPIGSFARFSLFVLFWVSFLLGYIIRNAAIETNWGFLSGGIGYELASLFTDFIGWGTVLIAIFALIVFIIYFFNVTTIAAFTGKVSETIEKIEENTREKVDLTKLETVEEESEEELVEAELDGNSSETENAGVKFTVENIIKPSHKNTPNIDFKIEAPVIEEEPVTEKPVTEPKTENPLAGSQPYDPTLDLARFEFPTVDFLAEHSQGKVQISVEELEANKDRIVETLANYGVGIASIKATVGPTVTLYEIVPQAGNRISKIKSLEDDIALSLAALGIRIIAPIPGKGTIGIEVPNSVRETVSMKSLLMSEKFRNTDKDLPIVLGKTISNDVYLTDLAKMPHLLMAGATGQGKSVGLNVILTSLLYKKHPSQIKFVLVDPKKVELTLYNKIERHYLAMLPDGEEAIITDTKKVVNTLNSLCIEMDTRYDLLKIAECRNLKEYNKKFTDRKLNPEKGHRFLPYIILVIDELADLMMTAGKEVEHPIARLAQLARATGIHLVVATQRPSVNVITGLIKANFPARLSFKVTSKVDSRTILDTGGAEQLVGRGDMLLMEGSDIIRLQCAFLDTPEVESVCDFIGSQRGYDSAYLLPEYYGDDDSGQESKELNADDLDPLFEDAARVIVTHQQGSTSLIQRKMKLGYNRAGRLIDQLEAAGVVGAFEGSKAREVLIHDLESLERLLQDMKQKGLL
jgi:S-DNA-T family DNA segregation ATPase FtsK/SpoIIIE